MLWPAVRALAYGPLENEQLTSLLDDLGLTRSARAEGPGAEQSIAHRAFVDEDGTPLVLDVARSGDFGWVVALFHTGHQPAATTLDGYRERFREAVRRTDLVLVQIDPPASVEEG
ncbi:hypothetical protein ACFV5J_36515 [Streptomyces zaomyceticus]|uniref:hypothetical protein n=1 Tax=Streptomyces zaomyceticus TaxID=68286 RepID=UPI003647CECF